MAYAPDSLRLLALGRFGHSTSPCVNIGPSLWHYTSDDPMTTVRGVNYISDARARAMNAGDPIIVVQTTAGVPTAAHLSVVLSVGASGADLADGTAITMTNS